MFQLEAYQFIWEWKESWSQSFEMKEHFKQETVREKRRAIQNEQCRDTDNSGHKTQNEDKRNKQHNTEN
jgi:hypothetical protein